MKALRFIRPLLVLSLAVLPLSARAIELADVGIPNFHQVDPTVFRGGQPPESSWLRLAQLGVRTVIDLRQVTEHSTTDEAKAVQAAGMRYVSMPMNGFETPRADKIDKVLALMNPSDTVFVHCKLGMDRTGTVLAAYRITRDGWDNARALEEAEDLGLHWYSRGMKRFIRSYKATDSAPSELASQGTESGVPTPVR